MTIDENHNKKHMLCLPWAKFAMAIWSDSDQPPSLEASSAKKMQKKMFLGATRKTVPDLEVDSRQKN